MPIEQELLGLRDAVTDLLVIGDGDSFSLVVELKTWERAPGVRALFNLYAFSTRTACKADGSKASAMIALAQNIESAADLLGIARAQLAEPRCRCSACAALEQVPTSVAPTGDDFSDEPTHPLAAREAST